jgi:hypothetical protein
MHVEMNAEIAHSVMKMILLSPKVMMNGFSDRSK